MCNLFLGLGIDAYVCVGRLQGCSEGDKRHVWVMTREANGDVYMWETTQGTYVPLLERWQGVQLSEAEKATLAVRLRRASNRACRGATCTAAPRLFCALPLPRRA